MTTITQAPPNELPRLSESTDFIPFRRGDQMNHETRARLLAELDWQPFTRDLARLASAQPVESAVQR